MSKGNPDDERESPIGVTTFIGKKAWYRKTEYRVAIILTVGPCLVTGMGLLLSQIKDICLMPQKFDKFEQQQTAHDAQQDAFDRNVAKRILKMEAKQGIDDDWGLIFSTNSLTVSSSDLNMLSTSNIVYDP